MSENESDILFLALEHNENLPLLDLHEIKPDEIKDEVFNFLSDQINKKQSAVRLIYGRGGKGILKKEVMDFLNQNRSEKIPHQKLVKDFREQTVKNAGGACVVLLEMD